MWYLWYVISICMIWFVYVHMCVWHVCMCYICVWYVPCVCMYTACICMCMICMCMVCGVCMRCIHVSVTVCTPVYMCEEARTGPEPSLFAAVYMETYMITISARTLPGGLWRSALLLTSVLGMVVHSHAHPLSGRLGFELRASILATAPLSSPCSLQTLHDY